MRRITSLSVALGFASSFVSVSANADPSTTARGVAQRLVPKDVALVETGTDRFGDGDVVTHFDQSWRGLPVIGRGVAVRLDRRSHVVATDKAIATDFPKATIPHVLPSAAANVAARFTALGVNANDAHLVVWPTLDRGARLAYAVVPHVPAGLPTAPRIMVDAQTGEVLEARDLVRFATARVFETNPMKSPGTVDLAFPIPPTAATPLSLQNEFIHASNCVDKKTVKNATLFGFKLDIHVCDLTPTPPSAGEDFLYEPSDAPGSVAAKSDPFSAVSIYFHATKAYEFFRDLQNARDAQVVADRPLRVIANLQMPPGIASGNIASAANPDLPLEPFQNAFFAPAGGELGAVFQQLYGFQSGALWFGQGPTRDYAYDGDVVYHEFGHAVIDATIKLGAYSFDSQGVIDAPGAMNEALADYFSSAITGDAAVGEYAATDLGAGSDVIRSLDNQDRCPNALIGEVHYDSTLFSGAMWKARASLGAAERPAFDAAVYKALRTSAPNPTAGFETVANLFLATLRTDHPSGAAALEKAMTDRGVLPTCARVLDAAPGSTVKSPEPRFGFASPGTAAANIRGIAPGILQVKTVVPSGTIALNVSFTSRSSGGGGGGNPLGGNATPPNPALLVKFGTSITWTNAKTPHDADLRLETAGEEKRTARIEVPEGFEGPVYFQVINTGESDGAYDAIGVGLESLEPVGEPPPTTTTTTTIEEGCSTSGLPLGNRSSFGLAGMAAAGLALLARLRRRSS